jgi:hypothetical protein
MMRARSRERTRRRGTRWRNNRAGPFKRVKLWSWCRSCGGPTQDVGSVEDGGAQWRCHACAAWAQILRPGVMPMVTVTSSDAPQVILRRFSSVWLLRTARIRW